MFRDFLHISSSWLEGSETECAARRGWVNRRFRTAEGQTVSVPGFWLRRGWGSHGLRQASNRVRSSVGDDRCNSDTINDAPIVPVGTTWNCGSATYEMRHISASENKIQCYGVRKTIRLLIVGETR